MRKAGSFGALDLQKHVRRMVLRSRVPAVLLSALSAPSRWLSMARPSRGPIAAGSRWGSGDSAQVWGADSQGASVYQARDHEQFSVSVTPGRVVELRSGAAEEAGSRSEDEEASAKKVTRSVAGR